MRAKSASEIACRWVMRRGSWGRIGAAICAESPTSCPYGLVFQPFYYVGQYAYLFGDELGRKPTFEEVAQELERTGQRLALPSDLPGLDDEEEDDDFSENLNTVMRYLAHQADKLDKSPPPERDTPTGEQSSDLRKLLRGMGFLDSKESFTTPECVRILKELGKAGTLHTFYTDWFAKGKVEHFKEGDKYKVPFASLVDLINNGPRPEGLTNH